MAVSVKIWDTLEGLDLDITDLVEGRLDLSDLSQARSEFLRALAAGIRAYTTAQLTDEEQSELEEKEAKIQTAESELETAELEAYLTNHDKTAELDRNDKKFMAKLATLQAEYSTAISTLRSDHEASMTETNARIRELQGKRGNVALDEILKRWKGKRPPPPDERKAPVFWEENWAILDLLTKAEGKSGYTGQFYLNGPTRTLYFYPTGQNWQAVNSYAEPGVWHKVGTLPEHTDLTKPTHVPRVAHRMIYTAGEHESLVDLFDSVMSTITKGSGLKGTVSNNAGGVVPLHLVSDEDLKWPRRISEKKWAEDYHWTEPVEEPVEEPAE